MKEFWNETKDQKNGKHKSWDKRTDRRSEKCRGDKEEWNETENEMKWNKRIAKMERNEIEYI